MLRGLAQPQFGLQQAQRFERRFAGHRQLHHLAAADQRTHQGIGQYGQQIVFCLLYTSDAADE